MLACSPDAILLATRIALFEVVQKPVDLADTALEEFRRVSGQPALGPPVGRGHQHQTTEHQKGQTENTGHHYPRYPGRFSSRERAGPYQRPRNVA